MNYTYFILDIQTGAMVGTESCDKIRLRRKAERMNLAYGAHRYIVKITAPGE